ncbi:MAG: hypothetical protein C5B49_13690 [Bdellovibrio sp.]|nr:MAG: hypothetical protein C5B49_13690 [Bdellovibrio sp.]
MGTKNSLSTRKNLQAVNLPVAPLLLKESLNLVRIVSLVSLALILISCQSLQRRSGAPPPPSAPGAAQPPAPPAPPPGPVVKEFGTEKEVPATPLPPPEVSRPAAEAPKLGVILGPGGLRAYAHAGVLQELHRLRVPIAAIGGLEMGALPAALYAVKPQGFEAEWQMMKLKEEDFSKHGFLTGKQLKDLSEWQDYLQTLFGTARIEDARIPFGCLTVNLQNQQVLMMNRGVMAQALPYCLSFPPFFRAFDRHVAGASQLTAMARYLRQKGATSILYVNVLGEKGRAVLPVGAEGNAVVWNVTSSSLDLQASSVQETLQVPLVEEITAFSRRREMVQKGKESAAKLLPSILQKMGFDL